MSSLFWAFFTPGPMEMVIIGVVAVLLFGKKLPDVGRSVGRSLMEFKKGMRGIEDELNIINPLSSTTNYNNNPPRRTSSTPSTFHDIDDREEPIAPKFDPPRASSTDTAG